MNAKKWIFLPLAFAIVVVDQLGKLYASYVLGAGEHAVLIEDVLSLAHIKEVGGAFGILDGWGPTAQLLGFASLSIAAVIIIVSFYRGLAPGEFGSAAGLGAILGGIASNGLDRIRFGSAVDFLHVGPMTADKFSAFNLADVAIGLGVVALIVELLATEMVARVAERPPR